MAGFQCSPKNSSFQKTGVFLHYLVLKLLDDLWFSMLLQNTNRIAFTTLLIAAGSIHNQSSSPKKFQTSFDQCSPTEEHPVEEARFCCLAKWQSTFMKTKKWRIWMKNYVVSLISGRIQCHNWESHWKKPQIKDNNMYGFESLF